MRQSKYFIATLKEDPAESEANSHRLMLRAGLIRKVAAGIYTFLPLGNRVLKKVENIVREEMNRFGAQEILMPALQPRELWEESGRWQAYGAEMMRLKDRKNRDFALGPTHEELITRLIDTEIRSYKELPKNLYQIQPKFRDELRPRYGVIRAREFIMKDAYSFDRDESGLNESYEKMKKAYINICRICGIEFKIVSATTGLIGGKASEEFMAIADVGEDTIFYCNTCGYSASKELARGIHQYEWTLEDSEQEKVYTPDMKTVEQVASHLNVPEYTIAKTLMYESEKGYIAAIIPGDREAVEAKIAMALELDTIRMLEPDEFEELNVPFGYVGPCGLKVIIPEIHIILDEKLSGAKNLVVGANEKNYHLKNSRPKRDFLYDKVADISEAISGDACPNCGKNLESAQAIEVGHIFQLGTKYSDSMKAYFSDQDGVLRPFVMGCYGVGVSRIIAAVIEQSHDDKGIIWPVTIAPFDVHIILLTKDNESLVVEAENLYRKLKDDGYEVLFDDREESPGVKFADADLIGIPIQVIFGKKFLKSTLLEVKERKSGLRNAVGINEISKYISEFLSKELSKHSRVYLQ